MGVLETAPCEMYVRLETQYGIIIGDETSMSAFKESLNQSSLDELFQIRRELLIERISIGITRNENDRSVENDDDRITLYKTIATMRNAVIELILNKYDPVNGRPCQPCHNKSKED